MTKRPDPPEADSLKGRYANAQAVTQVNGYNTSPGVNVTCPNGAENLTAGSTATVRWNASDNTGISSAIVYYGTDNGTWLAIANTSGTTDSCRWTVPTGSGGRIKVIVYDAAGNWTADSSDNPFAIAQSRLISGNGIEIPNFGIGSFSGGMVRYAVPAEGHVTLRMINSQGKVARTFVNVIQKGGEYNIPIKADAFAGGVYFLKLSLAEQASGKTMKDEIRKIVFLK